MRRATEAEVRAALFDARARSDIDPAAAYQELAREEERLSAAPELDPPDRDRLLAAIKTAEREISRRAMQNDKRAIESQERSIERSQRAQANHQTTADEVRAQEHLARMNRLLDVGRYREAAAMAELAQRQIPDSVAGRAAQLEARSRANIADMAALTQRRRQALFDVYRVDDAALAPIADDPPIRYPSASKWQSLTEQRRKWRAASTYEPSAGEERINRALHETTSIDFDNTSLRDAIDYLKARHGIEIQLDGQALSDAAVSSSAPITRHLKGVQLKSALRLILEDLDLTYVVRGDVLEIMSKAKADGITSTRVYPVADLVIPIPAP